MSTKLQFYSEFAERTARQITGSYRMWTSFLETAARLYMRFLLKLLFAPIVAVLAVFVWFCGGILYCASWVFGLASALVSILGVAVLVTYSVKNGIILLIIAFLVSPLGIPMLATKLLALLQSLRGFIQNHVYH